MDHIINTDGNIWVKQDNGLLHCCVENLRADDKRSDCILDCCMGLVSRIDTKRGSRRLDSEFVD